MAVSGGLMRMRFYVLTLFPEMIDGFVSQSIMQIQSAELIDIHLVVLVEAPQFARTLVVPHDGEELLGKQDQHDQVYEGRQCR